MWASRTRVCGGLNRKISLGMDNQVPIQDRFSPVINQLRKIRMDLIPLTEKYIQVHGFDGLDIPGESASMETGNWTKMAAEERLQANLSAFLTLERQLHRVVDEQKELLHSEESDLHGGLYNLLGQITVLRKQMEQLGRCLGLMKEWSADTDEVESAENGVFEGKMRGYIVLRDLSLWAMRSVRDLLKLQRDREKLLRESMIAAETFIEKVGNETKRE